MIIEQDEPKVVENSPLTASPLVNWKKPPELAALKQDFQDAQQIQRAHATKINTWLDNLNIEGSAKLKPVKGSSSIQPKLIRKQAEWRYAALSEPFLSTDDIFKVSPVTWEDRDAAKQNQLLLNSQFNTTIDKVRFIDEYVRTAVDEGTVIVQVGWCFEEEQYTETVQVFQYVVNPEVAPLHEYLDHLKQTSPSQYALDVPPELKQAHEMTVENGKPIEPVDTGDTEEVTKTRILKNHPTLEVCDFNNVVIDPTCQGDIRKANFVVKSFETCKAELLKYPNRYKNLEQINVTGNSILGSPDHTLSRDTNSFNFKDDIRAKFIAYEYHGLRDIDGSGKLVPIVATWVGDTLIRLEEAPVPKAGLPFVVEHYLPVRKSIYGEPDGALLEDNQKIIGAITRGMIDIMGKSANAQTGVQKGWLDATNRRKYDNGQDYEYNPGTDPRTGVYMHTYPEIPQSAPLMVQYQNQEAESLTGVKSYSQGVSGAALGDVAAGVRGALDAASKRELGILRRLSNGIVTIGRKVIAMNAELLSDEEVVRITNSEFVKVRRDDLPGNFDLKLGISTAEEDANKADQLAFMLQTIGPDEDPAIRRMVLADIARLRKMPDLAQKFETYEPQPNPVQQKMQELELAKLEAELAEIQAKTAETRAKTQKVLVDAGLAQAKVETEGAKARNLHADTDKKNLDFVEQESGTKQERDKELVGEQARAQGQTKILEHQLDSQSQEQQLQHDREKHQQTMQKGQLDLLKTYIATKKANSAKN
jgi:hypothetical protein